MGVRAQIAKLFDTDHPFCHLFATIVWATTFAAHLRMINYYDGSPINKALIVGAACSLFLTVVYMFNAWFCHTRCLYDKKQVTEWHNKNISQ